MAAGPKTRRRDAQYGGWEAPVREVADVAAGATLTPSDVTVYDPPLRLLRIGGAGTVVLVLDGNDGDVANHRFTLTVAANEELTSYAIRQVRAASTATGILGFR